MDCFQEFQMAKTLRWSVNNYKAEFGPRTKLRGEFLSIFKRNEMSGVWIPRATFERIVRWYL
jgi:hypothetical protein